MDRSDLLDLWEADSVRGQQNKDRPAFVREHRDAIAEHTSTSTALPPPDGSLADYSQWLNRYQATVTRQLRESDDGDDEGDEADAEEDNATN